MSFKTAFCILNEKRKRQLNNFIKNWKMNQNLLEKMDYKMIGNELLGNFITICVLMICVE